MASKAARKNAPTTNEDVRTWWQKAELKRVRVLRNSRKSVMVWMDKDGNEVQR